MQRIYLKYTLLRVGLMIHMKPFLSKMLIKIIKKLLMNSYHFTYTKYWDNGNAVNGDGCVGQMEKHLILIRIWKH